MAGNIVNPFEPIPEQPLSLDESYRQLIESGKALRQQQQDLNKAYINELSKRNSEQEDLPLPTNGNYKQAELQLLKDIIGFRPQTKEQVLQYLDSNPLLSKLYENDEGYKNAIANSVLRRSLELSNGQAPTYNELLGDVDPRTQIDYSNQGENPDSRFMQVVKNDILKPIDSFLHTDFMDKNKVARAKADSIEKLSAFGKDTQTAVGKLRTLGELKRQANELTKRATPFTEEGRQAELDLEAIQAKINSLALTDAEVAAYQKNGEAYLQEEARFNSIKDWEKDVNPRYIEDVQNDIEDAEFNQYMNLKYGNNSVTSNFKNMDYMKDFMGYAFDKVFGSKAKFINTLEELAPWMLLSIATGSAGTWGKLGQVALTVGSGTANIDTALDAYFQKYGTVEGFNKLQAFVGGGLNYLANMYGGHVTLRGIPSSTVNAIKGAINEEYGKTSAIIQKALNNVSDASIANSMVKAGLKNFSTFTLPSIVSRVGRNLESFGSKVSLNATKLGAEEATTKAGKIAETLANPKKAAGKMISGVGKALDSAVSKTVAGLVQGSIGGGASMALDNLTAEFATQLGNQTGYDVDKALQSALEGIPVGMAGHLGGLGANVVGRGGSYLKNWVYDKWKPLHKYKLSKNDMAIEDKILSNKDFIGTEAADTYLSSRIDDLEKALGEVNSFIENDNNKPLEGDAAKDLSPAEQKANAKLITKQQEAQEIQKVLKGRLDYLSNLRDSNTATMTNNAKTAEEKTQAQVIAEKNMTKKTAEELYSNEEVQKAKVAQAEALKENKEYKHDFGDEETTKAVTSLAETIDEDIALMHNFDKDDKFKSLVSDWNKETDEEQKDAKLNAISEYAKEFKEKNKATLKKADNDFLQNIIDRAGTEGINKKKTAEYERTKIDEKNLNKLDKEKTYSNKLFNDIFNEAYKNKDNNEYAADSAIANAYNKTDKSMSEEEFRKAYEEFAKAKQADIDMHNAKAESTNRKLYDTKEDVNKATEGLTEGTDYKLNTVKDKDGKEHYYITEPSRKYSKLESLIHQLAGTPSATTKGVLANDTKNTLKGVEQEFAEVAKSINTVDGITLDAYDKLSTKDKRIFLLKLQNAIDKANKKSSGYAKYFKTKKKEENVFIDSTYRQTGYSQVKNTVRQINRLEKFRNYSKHEQEEITRLHLNGIKLDPYNGSFQKDLNIAFNNLGIFEDISSVDQDGLNAIFNKSPLSKENIEQLEFIQRKLNSYIHSDIYLAPVNGVIPLQPYKLAIDNILSIVKSNTYKTSTKNRTLFGSLVDSASSESARSMHEKSLRYIEQFNNKCEELGITPTATGEDASAIDFSDVIEDIFNLNISSNVISPESRAVLSKYLGSEITRTELLMPDIADAFTGDIWDTFLNLTYTTRENTKRKVWQDLADSASDPLVKDFFSDKGNLNEHRNWKADFDAYGKQENKSAQAKIVRHLLTRREVLANLGILAMEGTMSDKDFVNITYPELDKDTIKKNINAFIKRLNPNLSNKAKFALQVSLLDTIAKQTSISTASSVALVNAKAEYLFDSLLAELKSTRVKFSELYLSNLNPTQNYKRNGVYNLEELLSSNSPLPDSLVEYIKKETFNINGIRNTINSANIPQNVQIFLKKNYGKLVLFNRLQKLASNKDKLEVLKQANEIFDKLYTTIPTYNEHVAIPNPNEATSEDLDSFRDILSANGVSASIVSLYIHNNNAHLNASAIWNKYQSTLAENNEFIDSSFALNGISPEEAQTLARAFAHYINSNANIKNFISLENQQELNLPKGNSSSIIEQRQFAVGSKYNGIFKDKYKSSLMQDNALERLKQENADNPAVDELVDMIRDAAMQAQDMFVVDSVKKHTTSQTETVGDMYSEQYVNTIATVVLRTLPTISTELSDDFKKELRKRYPNVPKIVDYFEKNNCVDLNSLATDMGKVCATALGYDKNKSPTTYEYAVLDTGMHCIALMHKLGYINVGRLNRATGDYIAAEKGNDFSNSINVVTLNQEADAVRNKIDSIDTFTNKSDTKESVLDNILGFTNRYKDPYDEVAFKTKQKKLGEEFDDSNSIELLKDDSFNDPELGSKIQISIKHDVNNGIIKYTEGSEKTGDSYYFNDSILYKKDNTEVTPLRLQQICSNMIRPPLLNVERTKQMMKGLIDDKGNVLINESTYATAAQIKTAVEQNPTLGILIDYKDPDTRSGIDRNNIHTRNKENIKKLIKSLNWLSHNIYLKNESGLVPVYYDEENTVNNRFFVNNIAMNYREDKILRNLFEMNKDTSSIEYTIGKERAQDGKNWVVKPNDLILPIFAGLGIDWDKMTPDQINSTKQSLANSLAFKTLLKEFDPDKPNTWKEAIDKFNASSKDEALNVTVTSIKPSYGEGNKTKVEPLELAFNHETIYTLMKLREVKVNGIAIKDSFGKNSPDLIGALINPKQETKVIKVTNYTLRMEIDGTTNGPAIRAMIGSLYSGGDTLESMLSTGVGITPLFTNFVDILDNGFLDTYLISGAFAQYDVAQKAMNEMLRNGFKTDESTELLTLIYGETLGTNLIDTLRGIMTRNFMKYPVMYITYSAGMESVSLDFFKLINDQLSSVLADPSVDTKALIPIISALVKYNGNNRLAIKFDDTDCYLDANGKITGNGVNTDLTNIENRRRVTLKLEDNNIVRTKMRENVLDPIYTATAKAMEDGQKILNMNNLATNQHAFAYNVVLENEINKLFPNPNSEISSLDLAKEIDRISEKLLQIFNPIISITDNTKEKLSGSDLNTFKASITDDVRTRLRSMTLLKGSKLILSNKYKSPYLVGLGAGQSPMTAHSMDSFNMTNFQELLIRNGYGKGLPIHDAIIAELRQFKAIKDLNRIFYKDKAKIAEICVERDKSLQNAMDWVATSDLPDNIKQQLVSQYKHTLSQTRTSTQIDVLYKGLFEAERMLDAYEEGVQDPSADKRLIHINQFSLDKDSAYTPTREDLEAEIEQYNKLIKISDNSAYGLQVFIDGLNNTNGSNGSYSLATILAEEQKGYKSNLLDKNGKLLPKFIGTDIKSTIDNIVKSMTTDKKEALKYRRKLRKAAIAIIRGYREKDILKDLSIRDAVRADSKKTVDSNAIETALNNSTSDKAGAVTSIFNLVSYFTQKIGKVSLHDDDNYVRECVYKAIMANKNVFAKEVITPMDILSISQDAVGIALNNKVSYEQQLAFNNIISNLGLVNTYNITPQSLDISKPAYIDYSDNLNLDDTWSYIESKVNKYNASSDEMKEVDASYRDLTSATARWFTDNVTTPLKDRYSNIEAGSQIVFTLRSKTDVLRMHGLQYLISKGEIPQATIVVVPAITDKTDNAPRVDKEVNIYDQLRILLGKNLKEVTYNKAPTALSNNSLIEAITDKTISENAIISRILDNNAKVNIVDFNGRSTTIDRVKTKADKYVINFTDEIGELKKTSTQDDAILPEIALSTHGIRNRSLQDIDLSEYVNASEEDLNSIVSAGFKPTNVLNLNTYSIKDGDLKSVLAYDRTGDVSNDNRALVINLCADGSPVANNLKLLDLDDVKNSLYQVQSSMRADYAKYMRGDITWKDYIKPRVIKATDSTGVTRHFVFQVTVDSSVTKSELFDAIQTKQRGNRTYAEEVVIGSSLAQWLNRSAIRDASDTFNFIKRNASDSADTGSKRIPIPRYLLNENILEINNYDTNLNTFNACCMRAIQSELSLDGVDTFTFVHSKPVEGEYILPDTDFTYNTFVLNGLNQHTASELTKDVKEARNGIMHGISSAINSVLSTFTRIKHVKNTEYTQSLNTSAVRNMRGYSNANTVNEQAGEMLNGEVAFRGALDICKQSDASRGVDTADSDLGWLDDLMVKSSTPIALYVKENSNTIGDSQVALLRDKTTGIAVREQITLGRANRGESQTESFRHEYAHTVWRHASPRERQELQKVFNTFVDNYQMSDFADGDTIANRQIIDAFTNEKTPDRLEEFGAYMVSNTALRQAVRNMQQRVGKTKIKENLIERISNIFKDIINKVMSFVSGSYSPKSSAEFKDLVKSVDDIFQSSYKSSAKFWQEAQQGIDVTVPDQFSGTTEGWDINVQRGFEAARQQNQKTRNMLPDRLRYLLNVDSAAFASEKGEQDLTQTLVDHARLFTDDRDSFFKEFASDILGNIEGASPDLYKYLSIRNKGKMLIDQQRERSAASVNEVVREILKDVPKEVENKLSDYFVKADISCLFNSTKSPEEVSKLLTDKSTRDKEIKQLTNTIKGQRFADAYINMAKGLANYLVTGFNPTGLAYRNAYEIVQLSGSSYQQATDANGPIVRAVDQLVTLYAVDMLNQKDPTVYNSLDSKVIDRLSTLHNGIKSAEAEMVYGNSEQRYHIPKGQIHGGKTTGRYDIIPQSELKAYEWNGYEKVEDAKLDPFYSKVAKEKYVIVKAKWKSPTPFTAGVTIMTDIFLGRAKSGLSYNGEGRVDKDIDFKRTNEFKQLKDYVNLRVNALNKSNPQLIKDAPHGNLVLNFNAYGDLTGANYELNPKVTDEMIGRNTKITAVFGDLYGSAVERSASPEYNKKAGEALIEIYENQKNKNPNDFIWISDSSENEDYRNMYDKLPYDTKQVCEEKYGDKGIPVMKKAINTVFGYKQISANDIEATKELNMFKDEVSKSFLDYAKWIFHSGISGNMEEFFKWLASTAKDNIVIKGITTSWNNLISNCTTLGVHGLSLKNVAKYQAEAFMAMRAINEWEKQLSALNTKKLLGTYNNNDAIKERTLKTNIEKSPLYPLYKRGIVSNSLAENEVESDKLLKDTIDKVLPKGPWRDFAHEMTLSPKGNLYQALFLFASAGDTVAKYSLYKDLRQRGASEEEACRQALETFIDYSNPLPRSIQYLDSLGIYPFAKYALGSKSSIINSLAKHSDRALGFIAANSLLLGLPNVYEGLFGTTTLLNKFNLPGELFVDSLNGLMSVRITNTLMDSL